ncbi:MAG: tRNA-intron lyase, partial [Zestosphaera sp.]
LRTYLRGWGRISGSSHSTDRVLRSCGSGDAYLIGSKAIVFNVDLARCIFSTSFIGKPVGVKKPKDVEEVDKPLELSLIEAYYLAEKGVLRVFRGSEELSLEDFRAMCREHIPEFDDLYRTFRELKDSGFIIRSALKYGTDFALYRRKPGLEHAPYLVKVLKYGQVIEPGDLISWGRLSHSVRKELILAMTYQSGMITYIALKWFKP